MLTTGPGPAGADDRPQSETIDELPTRTGGLYGRLPNDIVTDPSLSAEATCLLAYRSLHAGSAWGCSLTRVAKSVRSGFSRHVFQRAVKEVRDAGLLEREQGRRKKPGRGRGWAVDRLTFCRPVRAYVMVERDLFDGTLTPVEITVLLYLRARGDRFAKPWQLMKRLNVTRPTVSVITRGKPQLRDGLVDRGLVKNYGTEDNPLWGLATLKNPTLKSATLKKTTLTRKTYPSHQISPVHGLT